LACIALEPAFTRNAPRPETRGELGSMVVSGLWLGTKVDPSVWIIHIYQQTKQSLQLQAMLSRKVNGELLVSWSLLIHRLR
jgi:hypothetical protein